VAHPAPELGRLLEDLRRTRLLVTPQELSHRLPAVLPTGLPPLDRLLGGGLPEGRVVELGGAGQGERKGAHASALALRMLAQATSEGRSAAWVDRMDAFDPRGAAEAGADLERLLWCRPSSATDAVRAADVLLASGAFSLVILDLARPPLPPRAQPRQQEPGDDGPREGVHYEPYATGPRKPRERRHEAEVSQGAWLRLARDAESARASLIVLGGAVAAGVAAASLRVSRSKARFAGRGPGRTFEGLELVVALERNRLGLSPSEVSLSFQAPSHFPWPVREPAPGEVRSAAWSPAPGCLDWTVSEGGVPAAALGSTRGVSAEGGSQVHVVSAEDSAAAKLRSVSAAGAGRHR